MTLRAALHQSIIAAAMTCAAAQAVTAQGQAVGRSAPNRTAEDRRVDESARETQATRQTEAPRAVETQKPSEAPARSEAKPSFQRQAEPPRQQEPQRHHEPQRQSESPRRAESRPDDSAHWSDPGPAWRSQGPAWRDLNDRPSVSRPGQDAFRANQNTYAPRDRGNRRDRDRDSRRDGRGRGRGDKNVYIAVPYAVPYPVPYDVGPVDAAPYVSPVIESEPAPRDDDRPLGFLHLRVQPRTAEVFVDGTFAGTVDDFGGRSARQLTAGPHRVEIVADGYETLTFDVRVPENDTVTFTRELDKIDPARTAAAAPAAIPHKAVYVVPKCYIGDRPPLQSDMPPGCSLDDLRVIP